MPLELFFGSDDQPMTNILAKQGRDVCASCSVQRDCLIDALRSGEYSGLRGGYLGHERRSAIVFFKSIQAAIAAYDRGDFYLRRRNGRPQ